MIKAGLTVLTVVGMLFSVTSVADDDEIRVAVLTGAGDRVFCSGMDMTTTIPASQRLARGERIDLPTLVKSQTHDTARAVELHDRGTLAPGMKADINVIDFDNLNVRVPEIVHDLPAGGARLQQKAD